MEKLEGSRKRFMKKGKVIIGVMIVLGLIIAGFWLGLKLGERKFAENVAPTTEASDAAVRDTNQSSQEDQNKNGPAQAAAHPTYSSIEWCKTQLSHIEPTLSKIIIYSQSEYAGSDYYTQKGKDFLASIPMKQLFTIEYILQDEANFNQFIAKNEVTGAYEPTDYPCADAMQAYVPSELFIENYKLFFNEDFDFAQAMVMDKVEGYIYYDNKRSGLNGVSVETLEIKSISYDEENKIYTADIGLTYTERGTEFLGHSTDELLLGYKVEEEALILVSASLKEL